MIRITSINNYCSQEKLTRLARKSGFFVGKEKRHLRVEDKNGKFITDIPRHTKVKIWTANSF